MFKFGNFFKGNALSSQKVADIGTLKDLLTRSEIEVHTLDNEVLGLVDKKVATEYDGDHVLITIGYDMMQMAKSVGRRSLNNLRPVFDGNTITLVPAETNLLGGLKFTLPVMYHITDSDTNNDVTKIETEVTLTTQESDSIMHLDLDMNAIAELAVSHSANDNDDYDWLTIGHKTLTNYHLDVALSLPEQYSVAVSIIGGPDSKMVAINDKVRPFNPSTHSDSETVTISMPLRLSEADDDHSDFRVITDELSVDDLLTKLREQTDWTLPISYKVKDLQQSDQSLEHDIILALEFDESMYDQSAVTIIHQLQSYLTDNEQTHISDDELHRFLYDQKFQSKTSEVINDDGKTN